MTVGVRPSTSTSSSRNDAAAKSLSEEPADARAGLAVTVDVVEELGAGGYVSGAAEVGGEVKDLVVRVNGRQVPAKGTQLHVVPRPGETHVFSTSSGERLTD